jgi:UDP-2,4-diacetamido-2,4,6-trideoxy-beta-L-altropyranose hydrolase
MTLADELKSRKCLVTFVCRDLPGNLFALVEKNGYAVCKLPVQANQVSLDWRHDAAATIACIETSGQSANWVIVDHYELDERWESSLRPYTHGIMVIDDLADRHHSCDVLLDQNYYLDLVTRYEGLVARSCRKLLGPNYVLLRPEFISAREQLRERDGKVRRILVFFGGSDPENLTMTALEAIQRLRRPDIATDVVVGNSNPHCREIEQRCRQAPNTHFHCQVSNMAELTANADLAVGAGGAAMWERCTLGLPTITVVFAANQETTTVAAASRQAIQYLGWTNELKVEDYVLAIQSMIDCPDKLKAMADNAMLLIGSASSTGAVAVARVLLGKD